MKVLLTILFFLDTIVLAVLSFYLLKMLDAESSSIAITEIGIGIICSVFLMVYFVYRYLKAGSMQPRQ